MRNLSFVTTMWLLAVFFIPTPALCQEASEGMQQEVQQESGDAISRVELKADSLPEGFEITGEIRATVSQLYRTRQKIGFPLVALVNQMITYGGHQARVNYMAVPNDNWVGYGYSRLMKSDGNKGMIMAKDDVLIQMLASDLELENWLILLLGVDQIQVHKIRFHRFPKDWILDTERFLSSDELDELQQSSKGIIQEGLRQAIIVNRIRVEITYLDCITQISADRVGEYLAGISNPLETRLVKGYGSIIVLVVSTSDDLNREVVSHMSW